MDDILGGATRTGDPVFVVQRWVASGSGGCWVIAAIHLSQITAMKMVQTYDQGGQAYRMEEWGVLSG